MRTTLAAIQLHHFGRIICMWEVLVLAGYSSTNNLLLWFRRMRAVWQCGFGFWRYFWVVYLERRSYHLRVTLWVPVLFGTAWKGGLRAIAYAAPAV
jgi:hypothetical protein